MNRQLSRTAMTALGLILLSSGWLRAQDNPASPTPPPPALSAQDRMLVEIQQICPVSGKPLGSMGTPIKVQLGQQTAFVCCSGCTSGPVSPEHWARIQGYLAEAQGTCPIMGKPVDGTMKSTVVQGQLVFVCCPPCIEKIQAEPEPALAKVRAGYASYVQKRTTERDRWQISAQGICPVSGEPLGAHGEPVKVRLGDKEVGFLCCQSCVGKPIDPQHWQTIQANLAKAQGVCPVMGKPVTADMKFTVIAGRRVYVCCPPCIEKIEADPETYLARLNELNASNAKAQTDQ